MRQLSDRSDKSDESDMSDMDDARSCRVAWKGDRAARVVLPVRASSVFSRGVERSETPGMMAPPLNVSRQGIINFAQG